MNVNTDRLKLELRRASIPFLMLVVVTVAGIAAGANILRNLAGDKPWIKYKAYQVAFENPEGVVPGRHELRIAGVKAGSIKKSDLVAGKGVLTFNIEKKYAPLYKDAKVQIRPVTPLEDMFVDIVSRGHKQAGKLKAGEKGDILPAKQTESMVEVGRVLNVLDDDTRPRLESLIEQLGAGTKDNGEGLKRALAQIGPFLKTAQDFSEVLNKRRRHVSSLVHNLGLTTEVLGDRNRDLLKFVRSGEQTVSELAEHDGPLAATISQLQPTLSSTRTAFSSLESTEDRLDAALRSLRPTAAALPKGLKSLEGFSKDANPAVRALRPAVRDVRPLARQLRPTAESAARALPLLAEQAPQLDRSTATAAKPLCRFYIAKFFNRLMSMTKFSDQGPFGAGNARANVRVTATTAGEQVPEPQWQMQPPCFTGDETPIKPGGGKSVGGNVSADSPGGPSDQAGGSP